MKRVPAKKGANRPRQAHEGGQKSLALSQEPAHTPAPMERDLCKNCSKDLSGDERALFVEEEVGRVFCSESCITHYFTPDIKRLEKEYFKKLSSRDLSGEERENLAHLRWATLRQPDEIWREKTLAGDHRFTLISKYTPNNKPVWCVCICLFLRGDPSFLYLAFPTRNSAMTNHYRKGERLEKLPQAPAPNEATANNFEGTLEMGSGAMGTAPTPIRTSQGTVDGLALNWDQGEPPTKSTVQFTRSPQDIPEKEFDHYHRYFEDTLETPNEVWSTEVEGHPTRRIYHFIGSYSEAANPVWYVIIARDTDEDEEIEILDSFPTRDLSLVARYRVGRQEIGAPEEEVLQRVLH